MCAFLNVSMVLSIEGDQYMIVYLRAKCAYILLLDIKVNSETTCSIELYLRLYRMVQVANVITV